MRVQPSLISIYDFNPTGEELNLLFHPKLATRTKESYLSGKGQETLCRDIAALFWIRGKRRKARYYLSKTSPQQRMDFLNAENGF